MSYKVATLYALAGVAQLVGAPCRNQRVAGVIPGQDTCLGCGPVPGPGPYDPQSGRKPSLVQGCTGGNQSMFLSHIDVSLPSSLLKSNEKHKKINKVATV